MARTVPGVGFGARPRRTRRTRKLTRVALRHSNSSALPITDQRHPLGTISIKSSFLFLQWIFFIFKPTISIDGGEPQKTKWGTTTHEVPAGSHTVHIEIPYVFTKVGKATETVDVAAGETVSLAYKPPLWIFMKGRLKTA